jgi:hypothetical protein
LFSVTMLPAHETKHMPLLTVPDLSSDSASGHSGSEKRVFELHQRAQGDTNGTALWLGGQLLSAYLVHLHATKKLSRVSNAIELGAGIGLCGCVPNVVMFSSLKLLQFDALHVIGSHSLDWALMFLLRTYILCSICFKEISLATQSLAHFRDG